MQPVLIPAEMAAADAATMAAGVPEAELVERAGGAVARAARRLLGGTYGRRVVVVAGKGNNGADGLVAARLLDGWGARVDVLRLVEGIDPNRLGRSLGRADLAVDAMFGTGFRGPLTGEAASVATELDRALLPVLAVDIPSGVDGNTGAVAGPAVVATATVAWPRSSPGCSSTRGPAYAGEVEVADIGVSPLDPAIWVAEEEDVAAWLPPRPVREPQVVGRGRLRGRRVRGDDRGAHAQRPGRPAGRCRPGGGRPPRQGRRPGFGPRGDHPFAARHRQRSPR